MLKQPFGVVLQASSPGMSSRGHYYFSASKSSLWSSEYDFHSNDDCVVAEDDCSVTSLESFTFGEADLIAAKASTKQLTVNAARKPGSYFEKSSHSRSLKQTEAPQTPMQPETAPSSCFVTPPGSPPEKKNTRASSKRRIYFAPSSDDSSRDSSVSSFNESLTTNDIAPVDPQSFPYALAVATPISATKVVPCCDLCDRKDLEIQKQAQEIEQLKGLVSQLVTVLAQQQDVRTPALEALPQDTPKSAPVASPEELKSYSSNDSSSKPCQAEPQDASYTTKEPLHVSENGSSGLTEYDAMPRSAAHSSTILRLCRLKQLKEESGTTKSQRSQHCRGKRHLYVSVGGNWGYYNGPTLEQNRALHGCVVRFDNGDLYLGDMICHVPTTLFFNDEHGLLFHGRGNLYRKDGSISRGLFHKHQMIE